MSKKEIDENCIVHYPDLETYSKTKPICKVNEDRIRRAKYLRRYSGGSNLHKEQSDHVAGIIDPDKHPDIHPP